MAAVSCVPLMNVVDRLLPFHRTVEEGMKFVPVTVNVNGALPAAAVVGASDEIVMMLLPIVKVAGLDVPPPGEGLNTVILAVPAEAISAAKIVATSCVVFTNVVVRALPFHCTTEAGKKFVPVTVSENAADPAIVLEGESNVMAGAGFGSLRPPPESPEEQADRRHMNPRAPSDKERNPGQRRRFSVRVHSGRMGHLPVHPGRDCMKMLCLPAFDVNRSRRIMLLRGNGYDSWRCGCSILRT
jgi:hypothetical protein